MYFFFIGLFLVAFQVTCYGAPERLLPVPQRSLNISQEERRVEKRACLTNISFSREYLGHPKQALDSVIVKKGDKPGIYEVGVSVRPNSPYEARRIPLFN